MNKEISLLWIRRVMLSAALLYACTQIISVVGGAKQHDFKTYYYAAQARQQGLDPYDIASLQKVSGQDDLKLGFVYPPHSLVLFSPFARIGYYPAYYLFLGLKLCALLGLIIVWNRIIPVDRSDWWALCVTLLLGYRYALLRDIRSGNVSVFEQLLIWSGILLLLHSRSIYGGISVAISSVFKLITAALVPLIVIIRRTWRSFGLALVIVSGTITSYALLYLAQPTLWNRFLAVASSLDERGNRCPSSLALLRDVGDVTGMSSEAIYVLYALLCCVVFGVLTWAFITTRESRDVYPMMYLTILGYALLAPRMKDYSLIIALLPTLHVLSAMCRRRWQAIVGMVLLWVPVIDYQSLLLSAFVFVLLIKWISNHKKTPNKRVELTLNPLRVFSEAHS